MKIIIAPDSFKGSLSAKEVASFVAKSAKKVFPEAEVIEIPVADGGEGTLDAIVNNLKLKEIEIEVTGPDFSPVTASYAVLGDCAYIELARESGICLSKLHSARQTTTKGFGEAIKHAVLNGAKTLYLAIGGSATNDGGMGMLSALGVRFLDERRCELSGKGENLIKVCSIDTENIIPELTGVEYNIICDVQNPLLGETGATMTYGAQKGASLEDLRYLEAGMENFANVSERFLARSFRNKPGAGAAGGVGFALLAFLNGKFCPGIDTVLDIVGFDEMVKEADLVIVGEGKMDGQSAFGKAPVGVSLRAGNVPVVALVGAIGEGYEAVYEKGITSVFSLYDNAITVDEAISNAYRMVPGAAERMFRTIKAGIMMK